MLVQILDDGTDDLIGHYGGWNASRDRLPPPHRHDEIGDAFNIAPAIGALSWILRIAGFEQGGSRMFRGGALGLCGGSRENGYSRRERRPAAPHCRMPAA